MIDLFPRTTQGRSAWAARLSTTSLCRLPLTPFLLRDFAETRG